MDSKRAATMIHVTALLLLLGSTMFASVQALDLHHLKKGGCPPVTRFPSSVKVSLNLSGKGGQVMSGDVNKRSISPWEYSYEDVDNNRFPAMIPEAKCLHTGCLDAEGNVDISLNSVPITQEILVLRREMKGCVASYKLEKKMVTVGCTCARPLFQEQ